MTFLGIGFSDHIQQPPIYEELSLKLIMKVLAKGGLGRHLTSPLRISIFSANYMSHEKKRPDTKSMKYWLFDRDALNKGLV